MEVNSIILIGAGGHAQSCIDVIEQEGRFDIAGLVGEVDDIGKTILGYKVIGADNELAAMAATYKNAIICFGQIESAKKRIDLYGLLKNHGFDLPIIISPFAHVSRYAFIGDGTIVMHQAVINAGAKVGANCIINSCSLVEHSALVGDNCHISTGAVINGDVVVGNNCFVGSGAVLKHGVRIGNECIVGMGLSLRHNLPSGTILRA